MGKSSKKVSFPIIAAAASGDVDAINEVLAHYGGYIARLSTRPLYDESGNVHMVVLAHYGGYIARLSTRPLYDESGNVHMVVDESLRRRLETKLITKILNFKVA